MWLLTFITILTVVLICQGLECEKSSIKCSFTLEVEPKLTMMDGRRRVTPKDGKLIYNDNQTELDNIAADRVLTADGVYARLVIAINGQFPGPEIIMYEGQQADVKVVNKLHTDSVTVHYHGMHQRGSPWFDGVAYLTQCPILPGTSFTYTFTAKPAGTHWYHAHIGDQRSMGLYGPLIVKKKNPPENIIDEHIIILQDWNHDMDPETAYLKMLFGIFDCDERAANACVPYKTTSSVDGAEFSRFEFHSGLINGKGRYNYGNGISDHNDAPLTKYSVETGKIYRFRVISAATLYPFRVFVAGHRLTLVASDGRELKNITVDSFVVQSGERYDFYLEANQPPTSDYMIVAESIEVGKETMHRAEAILKYTPQIKQIASDERACTGANPCIIFNCPFLYYPQGENRKCISYNNASGTEEDTDEDGENIWMAPNTNVNSFFLNFAFPGTPGNTPGSVNGRQFISPNVAALIQPQQVGPSCNDEDCGPNKICSCAYSIDINDEDIVELVLLNMGNGRGWSHPIHLHGHSFYVLSFGFPSYNTSTGRYVADNDDIKCDDTYCNSANWKTPPPALTGNRIPPLKDTIIVPTGGYVRVRFKADNPGVWFLHCHIDLHNTNGMAMMVNESFTKHPKNTPKNFPTCGDFPITTADQSTSNATGITSTGVTLVLLAFTLFFKQDIW